MKNTSKQSTVASLNILKRISARFVGLGSLFIPKLYGNKTYACAIAWQLDKLNKDVPHKLEKALLLSPEQTKVLDTFNFVVTGFYGVGKTTLLEVAIERIVGMSKQFPKAKIIFVTWNKAEELNHIMQEKFKKIKDQNYPHLNDHDSLEVFSLQEICAKYQVKCMQGLLMQSWHWHFAHFLSVFNCDRSKVDVISDLCKKLKG